jgi:hypothetical protein
MELVGTQSPILRLQSLLSTAFVAYAPRKASLEGKSHCQADCTICGQARPRCSFAHCSLVQKERFDYRTT